jgi:CRP-like cAMP-binding protein
MIIGPKTHSQLTMVFFDDLLSVFKETAVTRTVRKGDLIIREGEIEKNLYHIENGAVKVFYLTELDEHIIRLGYDGSIVNSLSSFLKEEPSELYIEAIRQTSIKAISKADFLEFVNQNDTRFREYTAFLETLISQQIDRELDLLVTSPTERLNRVLKRSPHLFQHVPLKYIASYLRMKPETISRIRNS